MCLMWHEFAVERTTGGQGQGQVRGRGHRQGVIAALNETRRAVWKNTTYLANCDSTLMLLAVK